METLIVEDEDFSYQALEDIIKQYAPQLKIVGRANSVAQAMEYIAQFNPELAFMDIDLPDGTGFDIIQRLKPIDFSVIFVTAYNQFALQAFRFSATDYLLKPIDTEEFKEAIEKVSSSRRQEYLDLKMDVLLANLQAQMSDGKRIVLKTMEDIFIVPLKEIVCIQSDGSYSHFFLISGKRITVSSHLKKYEDPLLDQGFFRPHSSYLVNLAHVERFHKPEGGLLIMKDGSSIPVSNRKKEELIKILQSL